MTIIVEIQLRWIDKFKKNTGFLIVAMNFFSRARAHVIGNHSVPRTFFENCIVHAFSIDDGSMRSPWRELSIVRVSTMPQFSYPHEEWYEP